MAYGGGCVNKIRVLIVDDSPVFRRLLTEVMKHDPEVEVVGTASNGRDAILQAQTLKPDVITLDIEMPIMDGLSALKELRRIYPKAKVIMFSALTEKGAKETIQALSLGAFDFVTKPSTKSLTDSIKRIKEELLPKIKLALPRRVSLPRIDTKKAFPRPVSTSFRRKKERYEVIAMGVSTGGPRALSEIMPEFPANFPAPILIVQHMPPLFTNQLAKRLDQISHLKVVEASQGMPIVPGKVFIAPGDYHMEVREVGGNKTIFLHKGPFENSCRPAVDVLFRSVANVYDGKSVGVILTGMGQDGLQGSKLLKEKGALIIAQDEATCVVYGMPRAVVEAGLADLVLPLHEIPKFLQQIFIQRIAA